MSKEEEDHEQECQKEIVLSDHDALLSRSLFPQPGWHTVRATDVIQGTLHRDRRHMAAPDTEGKFLSSKVHEPIVVYLLGVCVLSTTFSWNCFISE